MPFRSLYPDVEIPEMALGSFVLADAAALGDKPALIDGPSGRTTSYAQLPGLVSRAAAGLAARLREHYPGVAVELRSNVPAGYDLVVNGTPLGMKPGDPLPVDVARLSPSTFVGEVVMKQEVTPLLLAARDRGCRYQVGTDMLFEMIPAYLEFFGFGTATPDELRAVAQVSY